MKKIILPLLLLFSCLAVSQTASDYAVRAWAETDSITPSVTLHWKKIQGATSYTIQRKQASSVSWSSALATPGAGDSTWTDFNVQHDTVWEYRISKVGTPAVYGYVYAGIARPPVHKRGRLILLVDSVFSDTLSPEITRLMDDLSGDGWAITRHDVSRTANPSAVKSIIVSDYNSNPQSFKSLLLLGHIPVPYSGDLNPDGHPDHKGAWPADGYYADVNGIFTDQYIDDTVASRPENRNVPGDGKFDQSQLPGAAELMTGRIDFANMPAAGVSETVMMKRYLDRNHFFRNTLISLPGEAIIDDNFGAFSGEAFAASAWRGFTPLFGDTMLASGDYFGTLHSRPCLASYGCGGGWYQGASGVGSTTDFINDSVQSVFTMLFGSYFGDWDSPDNFLRAPLASKGLPLSCCWSGRPHWIMHHMAAGEPIGFEALWAMNNSTTYVSNYGARGVHIALMGDPSLRMSYPTPVDSVVAGNSIPVLVEWIPSPDAALGYVVYRSSARYGVYEKISGNWIGGTQFYDFHPLNGDNFYMVRAARMDLTSSGTYVNLSTGVVDSVRFDLTSVSSLETPDNSLLWPNPSQGDLWIRPGAEMSGDVTATVFDAAGRTAGSYTLSVAPGKPVICLQTGITLPGNYSLCLQQGTRRITLPFCIVR